jgi:hypothetical protein
MHTGKLFSSLRIMALTGWLCGPLLVTANTAEHLPSTTVRIGAGEFRYFGFRIYQAELDAAHQLQSRPWHEQALTLTLTYQRALNGAAIAERSLEEMRRERPIDERQATQWLSTMKRCFPDVQEGDRLQGRYQPDAGIWFSHNGQARCHIADARFARQFMGIWLGEATSAPELRAQLLGLQQTAR